jgi:hypothetical protein
MPRLVSWSDTKTEDIRVGDWWFCSGWHYPCQVIDYLGNDLWLVDPHHKGRVKMHSRSFKKISPYWTRTE